MPEGRADVLAASFRGVRPVYAVAASTATLAIATGLLVSRHPSYLRGVWEALPGLGSLSRSLPSPWVSTASLPSVRSVLGWPALRWRVRRRAGVTELEALLGEVQAGGVASARATVRLLLLSTVELDGSPEASRLLNDRALTGRLLGVSRLSAKRCGLRAVPGGLADLGGALRDLDLGDNEITEVDGRLLSSLTGLEALNLAGNRLESLPGELGLLTRLERLGLRSNRLVELPAEIGRLGKLKEIYLTDNLLEALPESLGDCSSLVKIQASHNRLGALPSSLGTLPRVEMIRVACCAIGEVQEELLRAPKLAWLSLGGNPFSDPLNAPRRPGVAAAEAAAEAEAADALEALGGLGSAAPPPEPPTASWTELDLESANTLGSGASGEVKQVVWKGRPVAVKEFRPDASPDGRVEDELEIACEVDHPALSRVRARLHDPDGLLMDVAPGGPMALKPNHASLLRCRWELGLRPSPQEALAAARDLAAALAHLHALGVAHGDIYAHNALHGRRAEEEGAAAADAAPPPRPTTTLVDFGASFHYPPPRSREFQAVEMRAYGLLLADLIERAREGVAAGGGEVAGDALALGALASLRDRCLAADVSARPTFADAEGELEEALEAR